MHECKKVSEVPKKTKRHLDYRTPSANHHDVHLHEELSRTTSAPFKNLLEELYQNSGPSSEKKKSPTCTGIQSFLEKAPTYDDLKRKETDGIKIYTERTDEEKDHVEIAYDSEIICQDPPSSYSSIGSNSAEQYEMMHEGETERRELHGLKLELAHSRWSSTLATLHSNLQELHRAENSVLAYGRVIQAYATAMKANCKNKRDRTIGTSHQKNASDDPSSLKSGSEARRGESLCRFIESHPPLPELDSSITSDTTTTSVGNELTTLREALQINIEKLEQTGKIIMKQLGASDAKVEEAWGECHAMLEAE